MFEALSKDIMGGKYKTGQKFPSEAALVEQFGASRITVGRAVRELKQRGLVERIAGSGTYVTAMAHSKKGLLFGLLIPDLGQTEIFEPICQGIAGSPQAADHALLWGHTDAGHADREQQTMHLCRQFVDRKVSGVFFAPLERTPRKDEVNRKVASVLEKARIPVVLIDHCVLPFPQRSRHDLVGIDNRRAGYLATEHLLKLGARHIVFIAFPGAAPTVAARSAGYRECLLDHDGGVGRSISQAPDSFTESMIGRLLKTNKPDAFVCANDRTAGVLMQALLAADVRVPGDIRIVGVDDVAYASLLPVPLTTIHQPCRAIGEAALAIMLDRLGRPESLTRDVLLDCKLVIRKSCGAG
ncbi:MAG: GntR family transcriptional regulator [Acidobacteriota bacterium]|nr:GntR family transcriptional regulator [Acidobacteriota bacterium]